MGAPVAFSNAANFEAMSNPSDAAEKLKIASAYHKAFFLVNEEGTEAASATAVVMVARGGATAPKNERFIADHPLLFAIRDLRNGEALCSGPRERPPHAPPSPYSISNMPRFLSPSSVSIAPKRRSRSTSHGL